MKRARALLIIISFFAITTFAITTITTANQEIQQHKKNFYNPYFKLCATELEKTIEHLNFVLENFFRFYDYDNNNKVRLPDGYDKFLLTHDQSLLIECNQKEIERIIKEIKETLNKYNGDQFPLDWQERNKIFSEILEKLSFCQQLLRTSAVQGNGIFNILFAPLEDLESKAESEILPLENYLSNPKYFNKYNPRYGYWGYIKLLQSWENNFKNSFKKVSQCLNTIQESENILIRLENKRFTLLIGDNLYLEKILQVKKLPIAKLIPNRTDPYSENIFMFVFRNDPEITIVEMYLLNEKDFRENKTWEEIFNDESNLPGIIAGQNKNGEIFITYNPKIVYPPPWGVDAILSFLF